MKKYRYLIFDLDGTIIDSAPGIARSMQYSLSHFGIAVDDVRELYNSISLPRGEVFRSFGLDEEQCRVAMSKYREKFTVDGINDNRLFDGISELLQGLRSAGFELFVATCKPEAFTRIILDKLGVAGLFVYIAGGSFDGQSQSKVDVVRRIISLRGIADVSSAVFISGQVSEIAAIGELGVTFVGAGWGYMSHQALQAAGINIIADDPQALGRMFGI